MKFNCKSTEKNRWYFRYSFFRHTPSVVVSLITHRLIHALPQANKDFYMLIIPDGAGAKSGPHISSFHAFRRTWDYVVRPFLGIEVP